MQKMKHRLLAFFFMTLFSLNVITVVPIIPVYEESNTSPQDKIDPELLEFDNPFDERDVLISYNSEVSEFKAKSAIAIADETAEFVDCFPELHMLYVKTTCASIYEIAKQDIIEKIMSNKPREVKTFAPTAEEDGIEEIYESPADIVGAKDLWEEGYNGSGIVIAVLDTGVDILNPDLTVNAFASFVEGDSLPLAGFSSRNHKASGPNTDTVCK